MTRDTTAGTPAVVCFGETMGLVAPDPPVPLACARTLTLSHAGAESNVALGLARLGTTAAFCSRVGDDPFGQRIVADLTARGVDASLVRVVPGARTGVMFKDPHPSATRVWYYRDGSAAAGIGVDDAERALGSGARVVHLTGITPALSPSCAGAIEHAIAGAHRRGMQVSFDVNLRAALWPDLGTAGDVLCDLARRCDTVLVGLDEAEALWATTEPAQVRALLDSPGTLVVKDGPREAIAFTDGREVAVAPGPVDLLEPVGAGDAFAAGWWHARLRGSNVEEALRLGHECAAAVLASATDHPPLDRTIP